MVPEDARTKIKQFLAQFFRQYTLQDDDDIFALGFVNSLFAMQLILFIEKEFALVIENEDLDFENFRTVNAIVNLIECKSTPSV